MDTGVFGKMKTEIKRIVVDALRIPSYAIERRLHCSLHVFNYHQVASKFDARVHYGPTFTSLDFYKRQLEFLKSHFEFVSLADGIRLLGDPEVKTKKRHLAALTFDDGDCSLSESVPVALALGIPVTLFINSSYLDDENRSWVNALTYQLWCESTGDVFLPDELHRALKELRHTRDSAFYNKMRVAIESEFRKINDIPRIYLTKRELWQMNDPLISIGMHGSEHQRFSMMSNEWIANSIDKDEEVLRKHPCYCPIWAMPFGRPDDVSDYAIGYCLTKGIKVAMHCNGYNRTPSSLINRIPSDRKAFSLSTLASASIGI